MKEPALADGNMVGETIAVLGDGLATKITESSDTNVTKVVFAVDDAENAGAAEDAVIAVEVVDAIAVEDAENAVVEDAIVAVEVVDAIAVEDVENAVAVAESMSVSENIQVPSIDEVSQAHATSPREMTSGSARAISSNSILRDTSHPSSSSSEAPIPRESEQPRSDRRTFAYHTSSRGGTRPHAQQTEEDSAWFKHRRHVLIFTFSGKPVYTRFGTEEGIGGLTGTLSAIVAKMAVFFADRRDRLRYMSAGKRKFSFVEKGPLWLVCISNTGDTLEDHSALLDRVYYQIVTILTTSIEATLHSRPNYDLRHLLGGTDTVIKNLIRWCTQDVVLLLDGFEPLPLPPQVRNVATESLRSVRIPNLIFGAIVAEQRVVAMVTNRNYTVNAMDFSLVLNLVLSSASQRSDDLCFWTPVCLAHLNAKAFAYGFIQFINDTNIGIMFLSAASDGDHFYAISEQATQVKQILVSTNTLDAILRSSQECPVSLKAQPRSKVMLAPSLAGPSAHLLDSITHAAFFIPATQQFFSSTMDAPSWKRKHIIRKYGVCKKLLKGARLPAQICVATDHEVFFVWWTMDFHMYLCVPKGISTNVISLFYQWVRRQELYIFLSVPTW